MLKHIILLFQKSLIIININCCCRYKNFFEETIAYNSKRVAKAENNYLGGIIRLQISTKMSQIKNMH